MDGSASSQLGSDELTVFDPFDDPVVFRVRVTGTPKPKGRPRTVRNRHTGFVQTYTPSITVNWEQTIVAQTKQALAQFVIEYPEIAEQMPFTGRLDAQMVFYVDKPKSAPKSVQYPLKARTGDVDNLVKSVLDSMQLAGVIADDKTVTDLYACKRFTDEHNDEGVYLQLTAWAN